MPYNSSSNKPNPFLSKEEKLDKSYGVKWGKYIQSKGIGSDFTYYRKRRDRIREARAYAQGNQSNERYKQRLNATGDSSPINLDFTPMGIGAKFVNALVDDILRDFHIDIQAIDPVSLSIRKDEKTRLLGLLYDKDYLEELEKEVGIELVNKDNIPESLEEVELHMDIAYKQSVEIAMQEAIRYTLELNDYPDEVRRLIAYDLITAGTGIARVELDPSYGIKTEYVDAENFISSESTKPNNSDIQWGAEMKWMSIGDVRRLAGNQLDDTDIKKIYDTHKGRGNNDEFFNDAVSNYNNTNGYEYYEREYDSYVIPVIRFCFKSIDRDKIKITKSKAGERRYLRSDTYKPSEGSKNVRVEEDVYESVYGGYYILSTDYVFNYGAEKNLVRPNDNLNKVELPYKVYSPQFYNQTNKSLVEMIIPYIDQFNINFLKLQQVMIETPPMITKIDLNGWFTAAKMLGKNWKPLDFQDIFSAKGIAYTVGRDENGDFVNDPIQSYPNKLNIEPYIAAINYNIQLIREVLGFTPEREGITSPKQLVGTTEISIASSRNATNHINHALNSITKKVVQDISWRIQDIEKDTKLYRIYKEAIGAADMAIVDSMGDIPLRSFGIFIRTEPANDEMLALSTDLERAVTQKELRPEDSILVRKIAKSSGIDAAYQFMTIRRKRYQKELMQREMMLKQQETQRQLMMQKASAEAKTLEQQGEAQLISLRQELDTQGDINKLNIEYNRRQELSYQEYQQDLVLKGVADKSQLEKERMKEDAKDERVIKSAVATAQQKEQVDKVKSGEQRTVNEKEIEGRSNDIEDLLGG